MFKKHANLLNWTWIFVHLTMVQIDIYARITDQPKAQRERGTPPRQQKHNQFSLHQPDDCKIRMDTKYYIIEQTPPHSKQWTTTSYERPVVTSHFTVQTSYYRLHTSDFIVSYVIRCMEDNGKCQFKVHDSYFTLHGSDFIVHSSYYILHTSQFRLHSSNFTLHISYFTALTSHFILHTSQYIVRTSHFTILTS